MLVACWSSKGGSGTTVVASSLALLLARRDPLGALLVDVGGDVPAALGVAEPSGPGLAEWLAAGSTVPADGLHRLEVATADGVAVVPRGHGALDAARADALVALLAADARPVVADCGTLTEELAVSLAAGATRSLLVIRPCFLGLRRAMAAPLRPSEVVMVTEPGRSLSRVDVEECLGAPVVAEVALDPAVARAVDAGLLAVRLPRGFARDLGRAA